MSAEIGFIYVLSSPMYENCYKVGCSTIDPIERARQLSASSGVPYPFTVAYQRKVEYPFKVEAAVHRTLEPYRLNNSREFFRHPLHKIIAKIEIYDELLDEFYSDDIETPWGDLFKTFPDNGSPRELTLEEQSQCRKLAAKLAWKASR